jgi:uncharacterized RDD family membrane protein YckC
MREEWYVELDGAMSGPHNRWAMLQMHDGGRIAASTPVRCAGTTKWMPYIDAGLDERSPPPLSTRHLASAMSAGAGLSATVPDTALAFDLSADEVPQIDSEFGREDVMRRVTAERNATRRHISIIDGVPSYAPPLQVEDDGWQWVEPAPWRRYLARMLDVSLLGMVTWAVFGIIAAATSVQFFETLFRAGGLMKMPLLSSVVVMASLIPVQALLIGTSGTTIGKWIFGVRITRRDGSAIGLRAALLRELSVFGLGVACGVPILTWVTALIAYNVLSKTGCTQWDRGKDWIVTQREPGDTQTGMFILGVVVLFVVVLLVQYFRTVAK